MDAIRADDESYNCIHESSSKRELSNRHTDDGQRTKDCRWDLRTNAQDGGRRGSTFPEGRTRVVDGLQRSLRACTYRRGSRMSDRKYEIMRGVVREMGRKAATAERQTRRTRAAYMAKGQSQAIVLDDEVGHRKQSREDILQASDAALLLYSNMLTQLCSESQFRVEPRRSNSNSE